MAEAGGTMMGSWLRKLEYADDAVLMDSYVEEATERITRLAAQGVELADMEEFSLWWRKW